MWLAVALAGALFAQSQPKQAQPKQAKRPAPPAASAPAPAPKPEFSLESLRVTGNKQIPAERIVAASGLVIGKFAEKSDFDAARQRLLDTGAFENVGYEYKPAADGKGYDAVFEVIEAHELFPYRFEDLPAQESALRDAVRKLQPLFTDRIPATAQMLVRYVKAVQEVLAANGNADLQVSGKVNAEAPGELAVLFRPTGSRPNIAEVKFSGNKAVPTTLLLRTINEVAIGLPYTEAAIRQRLDAGIRRLYEARGYIRVSFPNVTTEKASKVEGLVVDVAIDEGPVYGLGAVRFTGAPSSEAAGVERTADFKKAEAVNFDEIDAGLQRVYKRLRGAGFLHASGKVIRDIHDDTHIVDLTVALDPGPRFVFGKLDIQGLDIIAEPVIRKMWGSIEGKPFNPEFPDSFLARVREEGVLSNLGATRSETHLDETAKTVGITLYFNGAGPQEKKRPAEQAPPPQPPPDIW
jgi:outer membrane protein assembly factor BamA